MINNVAFSGRETMLTNGLQTAAKKVEQSFIKPYSILPPLNTTPVQVVTPKSVYTSPFALIDAQESLKTPVINRCGLDFFA